jgi:hypothetical protein
VKRLENRGGEIWVMSADAGVKAGYTYAGRDGQAVIIAGPGGDGTAQRWVLRTDLDRSSLARAMDATVERLSSPDGKPTDPHVLMHRLPLETDAGTAQIGCFVVIVALVPAILIVSIAMWALTGRSAVTLTIAAGVVAFVVAFFGTEFVGMAASHIPSLRGQEAMDKIALVWWIVAPIITGAIIIVVGYQFGLADNALTVGR